MNQDQRNVILTIREYENSVDMPDEERVTYLDPRGGVHLKEGDGLADRFQYVHWAERCAEYLRFGDEVDLATCGAYDRHSYLKICDTPLILLDAGFEQKPMLYTQKHLFQALRHKRGDDPHRHGLTVAQVKRFPELFESPVLLADNPSRDDAMLMVLRAVDSDKLPIITSIKPDGRGNYELQDIETNMVLTVFGKKNFARYFELALSPDMILYIDKERGQELERLSERPLFGTTQVLTSTPLYAARSASSIWKPLVRTGTAFNLRSGTQEVRAMLSAKTVPPSVYRIERGDRNGI